MDFNADLGESWYSHKVGNDEDLMPYIDSCNIACGMHGGDALTMQRTIELAIAHGVNIGAHPSYPDREYFGRRKMTMPIEQLAAILVYQVAALYGMVLRAGGQLKHLKIHGALYHQAAFGPDEDIARAVVSVAHDFGNLAVLGPQDSHLERIAKEEGVRFVAEGYVDRYYEAYNRLVSRSVPKALIVEPENCARQAADLLEGRVQLRSGEYASCHVESLCVHGDQRWAVERARAVRALLNERAH